MATTPRKTVTRTEFDTTTHRIAELRELIAELERKSKGITRANAGVAGLKALVTALTEQLRLAEERYTTANDPAIKEAAAGQIDAVDKRVGELFGDVNKRVDALEATAAKHTGLLADLGELTAGHTTDIATEKGRNDTQDGQIGRLEEGQSSLNVRVSTLEPARVRGWVYPIAMLVGLIVGLIWNGNTFVEHIPLPNKQVVESPYVYANSGWTALGVGILAAAATWFILSFITKKDKQTTTVVERDRVIATPPPPAPSVVRKSVHDTAVPSGKPAAEPTPTTVLPRTEAGVLDTRA